MYASLRAIPRFAENGQVLFVSVDAERDTPQALRRYVSFFDPRFRAATAPPERLHLLTRQLAAESVRISGAHANEVWFDHSAAIYLIAPSLDVVGEFLPPHDAAALARDTRDIIAFIDS
jgi:protein SCO1/2